SPAFSYRPEDTEVREGESVVLHCSATGYPRPTITWTKSDEIIPNGKTEKFNVSPSGSLQILNVERNDHGTYECLAANGLDSITAVAQLIVLIPPGFDRRPSDQIAVEGRTIEFICRAYGNPEPVIAWTKMGNPLPEDRRHTLLPDGTLRIARVTKDDEGSYECQAINTAGHRQSTANLEVSKRVPPVFLITPTDLDVVSGSDVQIPCNANGYPLPTITWSKDGIQISESNKFYINPDGFLIIRDAGRIDQGRLSANTEYPGDNIVNQSINEAIANVDRAFNSTRTSLFDKSKPRTPSDLLTLFKFPTPEAIEIARAAEIFETTLEIIHESVENGMRVNLSHVGYKNLFNNIVSPDHLEIIANLSGCTTHRSAINCSDMCYHQKYRSYDGTCNNLQHVTRGSALTAFSRILKPIYENGFNTPVGWNHSQLYYGVSKPSARLVSIHVAASPQVENDEKFTHMLMQWGQFTDHDLDLTVLSPSKVQFIDGQRCNETCDNQPPCFPIPIPEGDPRIVRSTCMEFTRSSAVCGSGSTSVFFNTVMPREQINSITSYIDASNVYGSSKSLTDELRDFASERGLLRTGNIVASSGKPLLPFNRNTPIDCLRDENASPVPCFLAGDARANEQLGLLSMHTIWMRESNRIATQLLNLNPHWDGETLFQESRKIVGAQMQHITYTHWLPKILGPHGMQLMGEYTGYNPNTDSSIINAFATAAFRFGHGIVNPVIYRLNSTFQPIPEGNIPLHRAFFSPYRIVDEGGIDPVLRGLFGTPAKDLNSEQVLNTELTEHLFEMVHHVALDLAALNIQRGRDHALPGYNDWRVYCNMSAVSSFNELKDEISNADVRDKLERLYHHPGNVDLWVAGMVEDPLPGGILGPTFTCIIAKQFQRTRDGDRFWYENPGVFTAAQLTQIKQTSLSSVICENSDHINRIQKDVFLKATYPTGYLKCEEITAMDLRVWTDCCEDCSNNNDYSVTQLFRFKKSDKFTPAVDENKINDKEKTDTQQSMGNAMEHLTDIVTELQQTVQDLLNQ
uniref:Peroxidasin-like n=1 Tax=Saccoglossus kowalevskii TaxID=10224 RepID=A0ABM0M4I6_SACKO